VVAVLVVKPFYFVHFQRAIIFVQSRVDLNMMPLMLSYRFRVLHPVACFVPVIFHYVIVAIFSNIASHGQDPILLRESVLSEAYTATRNTPGREPANGGSA
jgi:hypothetical protein